MTFRPPFARMRQIRANIVRPEREPVPDAQPANVTEALSQLPPEAVIVVEEPEPVLVAPREPEPVVESEPVVEVPAAAEPEVAADEVAKKYPSQMKKSELVVLAANLGIPLSDEMTKAQILDALKAAGH